MPKALNDFIWMRLIHLDNAKNVFSNINKHKMAPVDQVMIDR